MKPDPVTVTPDDTLADALRLTRQHRIRHLPVVLATGRLAGVVSDRDIRLAMPSPLTVRDAERTAFLERTSVAAVMTREVVTCSPSETIEEAAKRLHGHRIGSLPVVDPGGQLIGIVTESDILHAFVELLGGTEPSSRIEILLEGGSQLPEAVRLIAGEAGAEIVSMVMPSLPAATRKTAILHLATIDPREVVRVLESSGFKVGWPSLDADLASRVGGAAQ